MYNAARIGAMPSLVTGPDKLEPVPDPRLLNIRVQHAGGLTLGQLLPHLREQNIPPNRVNLNTSRGYVRQAVVRYYRANPIPSTPPGEAPRLPTLENLFANAVGGRALTSQGMFSEPSQNTNNLSPLLLLAGAAALFMIRRKAK